MRLCFCTMCVFMFVQTPPSGQERNLPPQPAGPAADAKLTSPSLSLSLSLSHTVSLTHTQVSHLYSLQLELSFSLLLLLRVRKKKSSRNNERPHRRSMVCVVCVCVLRSTCASVCSMCLRLVYMFTVAEVLALQAVIETKYFTFLSLSLSLHICL